MELIPAYLDPGSGSVILQALLGGAAGLAVTLKLFGRRILSFLPFVKSSSEEDSSRSTKSDAG